jgi:D-lactate dehydrogenase
LKENLLRIIPETRIRDRFIDRVSFASDAGFYYLLPKAVVQPLNEKEIIGLFEFSRETGIPLVFRTGGTSLSGQSITDGVLVDLSQHWNRVVVEEDGARVRCQPGITGAMVNAHLRQYRRKIGPDPSSIGSAMMGGILSNNSSGMCCGVKLNSYHTTRHIRFILPDGKVFSTERNEDYLRLEHECPELFQNLQSIRTEIFNDPELLDRIRNKYLTKNTVGYSLNAFVDFDHPLDILAHLLIGAEGTLGFISEAVLHTVPDYPFKSTGLLYFPDIYSACQAIVPLTNAGAMMVELMDRASLRAVENVSGMPAVVKTLPATAAALLVEFQENSREELRCRVDLFQKSLHTLSLLNDPVFSEDPKEQDFLWKVRKGLFPAVGAVRASGTTVILEDVAFPVHRLGDAILDLQLLFTQHNYHNAIIFGHAKDGNIHFVVTQSFGTEAEVERYDAFIRDVVDLVVEKYDGTLKAEHGTGRNMAPFVETEWGGKAYEIIRRIKASVDPMFLLNPGVIVNDDKRIHIRNLKNLPSVEAEVDKCIECGYCEHRCPSRDLTTSPRRRIVVRRVLKDLELAGNRASHALLLKQYQYDGIDTCAVDGLCATACPVDINTGDLIKRLRKENHSAAANRFATTIARNFSTMQWLARVALKKGSIMNGVFGASTMMRLTSLIRKIAPATPLWSNQMTYPPSLKVLQKQRRQPEGRNGRIVYFPACISRMMGSYSGKEKNLMETFISVCGKVGIGVDVLADSAGACCGQIFSSKGFSEAYRIMANDIVSRLWRASGKGTYTVVIDVSSCAHTLHQLGPALSEENKDRLSKLTIMDSIDFLHDMVLPVAEVASRQQRIVLHPVCSLEKMKTQEKFIRVAQQLAAEVDVPANAGCCGMAGDRGFLFPELTQSATAHEANMVRQKSYSGYYSSTRTCEMAMSEAVNANYVSILYLADEAIGTLTSTV